MISDDYRFNNTKLWAEFVVNDLGCSDLKLQYMYLNQESSVISTPRVSYWELAHKDWNESVGFWNLTVDQFWLKANNCSGLDILVPLDFDDGSFNEYLSLTEKLKVDGFNFIAYAAGERCRHIHLFFPKLRFYSFSKRKEFKHYIIEKYSCDGLKASDSQNIPICFPALEGQEPIHWKTKLPIQVVVSNV